MMDINEIKKIIPHRYPFLLVDRIIECDYDSRIVGIKNVTADEPFFQGHFPEFPVMPGVLIIEALAQTACILGLKILKLEGQGSVFFTGIDGAKFRKPVVPGDQLRLRQGLNDKNPRHYRKLRKMALKKRFIGSHIFYTYNTGIKITFDNSIYKKKRIPMGDDFFNFIYIHHKKPCSLTDLVNTVNFYLKLSASDKNRSKCWMEFTYYFYRRSLLPNWSGHYPYRGIERLSAQESLCIFYLYQFF